MKRSFKGNEVNKYLLFLILSFLHGEKIGTVKNFNFNLLCFKRCSYDNNFWPINFGDLNIMLGA